MAGEGDAERLVVLLEARVRDFEKNMQKASGTATQTYGKMRTGSRSATRQMEADMVRSTGRINTALASTSTRVGAFGKSLALGFVAPVAGLLTLNAALNGTKAALQKFGDIADKSAAAGVDSEFFQSIAYQAKLAGVEVDAVAGGLASFAKNAGLAAEGKGRMVAQLQVLNPELLRNIQLATTQEQRVRLVADAIASAKDPAQAAAIASATLGDAGVKLVAAFQGGAAHIDEMISKAKELGIVVSRDVIARADELGDEFDTVTEIADNNLKQALVNLGPVLVGLTGYVANWTRDLSIVLDQLREIEDRTFINPLQNKLVELENLRAPIMEDLNSLRDQLAELDPASGMAGVIAGEIEQKAARAEELMQQALEYQERIAQLQGKPAGAPRATPPATKGTGLGANGLGGADLELANLNLPDIGKIDEVATGFRRVSQEATEATFAIASGTGAVDRLREQFEVAEELASSFASTLISDLSSGKDIVESLKGAFGQLSQELLQMAANQAIKELFSTLLGALGSGLTIAGGAPIPKGGFTPGISGPKLFADGTANTGGQRGEPRGMVHGQEAVIPLPSGGKVPVEVKGSPSGGDSYVFSPTTTIDARGSNMTEGQLKAMLDQRDRQWREQFPSLVRKVNSQPRKAYV